MPRSSRHKSHKQSKHSSKDNYYNSESEEDVKMKESVRVSSSSRDINHSTASGEKRKLGSKESNHNKDSKDLNGEFSEDYVLSTKRRKEKADGSDRWNGGIDDEKVDIDKESSRVELSKGRESKGMVDPKSGKSSSSSSKKHEESMGEKEEGKSGRSESKRKSERESSGRKENKDSKESREKKGQESKRDVEARAVVVDLDVMKKQGSQSVDYGEDRQSKRGRENSECMLQDELRNPELEKELEKRLRRRRENSIDRDKHQDDGKDRDEKRLSSKSDRVKDATYREDRHKDGSYGGRYQEDGDRDDRYRDDKYWEDADKDIKLRDDKYWEDGDRERHRDDKYGEDGERDNRRRDEKYREDGERYKRRDDKYREDGEKDGRRRDDKYREDGEKENRRRDDRYHDDGDKDNRRTGDRYREDGDKDDRHRDEKSREDGERDYRHKEEKHRDDLERDGRRRDGKQGVDVDREKRQREAKYRDEHGSRDRPGDNSDNKRFRDDPHSADPHYRKSSMRDDSPSFDDRTSGYKDDQGRRRTIDKEEHNDVRSRSTKDQRSEVEKRSVSSGKVDLASDRGRSLSRNADIELTSSQTRRRSSPGSSSQTPRDHYRAKQDESKYREYAYDERGRYSVVSGRDYASPAGVSEKISSSRSVDKVLQKDDAYLGEISADRRLKLDARASPLHLVDKSPSSTSTDRRHLGRSDVRRSLDIEDQRSGGSRDAREYSSKEGRGSRERGMDGFVGDELFQADGDNVSVSSPFIRSSSKSLLPPPPPFRTGLESPSMFGSSEDDNRGRLSNRHRRMGDATMGRMQGNAWKAGLNWPTPMANGFMPFQHGPPPVGFHPVMQQFPGPPIFGVRPSLELNPGIPYHMSDAERFGHGRSMGWRNPMDDSCPTLHGWDSTSTAFGDESHIYGRPEWDSRNLPSGRGWESSGDMWKAPKGGSDLELPSASEKENLSSLDGLGEGLGNQPLQQSLIEEGQPDQQAEVTNIRRSSDALEKKTPDAPKSTTEETPTDRKLSGQDDARSCQVYLSKLDISADLADPEIYDQCIGLIDADPSMTSEGDDSRVLFLEEAVAAKSVNSSGTHNTVLFAMVNDSVFQKAMSLYKKQREEIGIINGKEDTLCVQNETLLTPDEEKVSLVDVKVEELPLVCDAQNLENVVLDSNEEPEPEPEISLKKAEETEDKLEEALLSNIVEQSVEQVVSASKLEVPDQVDLENSPVVKNVEQSDLHPAAIIEEEGMPDAHPPAITEDVGMPGDSIGNQSACCSNEQKLVDIKCGPLLFDVSSEACEAVMPELIESGSVNLSRIHHSPESTH